MQMIMFSKMLGQFPIAEAGDIIRDIGFEGVDLTVRPAGHVLPERVRTDLEPALEVLRDRGLSVPMITTGIESADDPTAEAIFETAAACGIDRLKLGYWPVRQFGSLKAELERTRQRLTDIARLADRYGVSANIHVHSGDFLSAQAAVVWMLIAPYEPSCIGAYPDLCHMGLEGARSGWKQGLDLLGRHINMVGVKNGGLFQERADSGQYRWHWRLVPVWEGITPFADAFGYLREIGFDGPCSFHSEYDLPTEELIAQTRKDLQYVRGLLAGE